jgi:hypothetical protein
MSHSYAKQGWNNYSPFKRLLWDATHASATSTALSWSMSTMTQDRERLMHARICLLPA